MTFDGDSGEPCSRSAHDPVFSDVQKFAAGAGTLLGEFRRAAPFHHFVAGAFIFIDARQRVIQAGAQRTVFPLRPVDLGGKGIEFKIGLFSPQALFIAARRCLRQIA